MINPAKEALKTAQAHWLRTLMQIIWALLVTFIITQWGLSSLAKISDQVERDFLAGAGVVGVSQEDLSASKCEALNSVEGITAAGSILNTNWAQLSLPSKDLVSLEAVTAGYVRSQLAFTPPKPNSQVFISKTLSKELGLHRGSYLEANGQLLKIDEILPDRIIRGELARTIWVTKPAQGFIKECVVKFGPLQEAEARSLLNFFFTGEVSISPIAEYRADLASYLDQRQEKYWPLALPLFIGILWLTSLVLRRKDLALYLLLGFKRSWVVKYLIWDYLGTVVFPVILILGSNLALMYGTGRFFSYQSLLWELVSLYAALAIVVTCGTLWFVPKKPLNVIKGS